MFWLFWTGICFLASRANNIKIGIYLMLKRLFKKKKFSLLPFQLSLVKQSLYLNYFATLCVLFYGRLFCSTKDGYYRSESTVQCF